MALKDEYCFPGNECLDGLRPDLREELGTAMLNQLEKREQDRQWTKMFTHPKDYCKGPITHGPSKFVNDSTTHHFMVRFEECYCHESFQSPTDDRSAPFVGHFKANCLAQPIWSGSQGVSRSRSHALEPFLGPYDVHLMDWEVRDLTKFGQDNLKKLRVDKNTILKTLERPGIILRCPQFPELRGRVCVVSPYFQTMYKRDKLDPLRQKKIGGQCDRADGKNKVYAKLVNYVSDFERFYFLDKFVVLKEEDIYFLGWERSALRFDNIRINDATPEKLKKRLVAPKWHLGIPGLGAVNPRSLQNEVATQLDAWMKAATARSKSKREKSPGHWYDAQIEVAKEKLQSAQKREKELRKQVEIESPAASTLHRETSTSQKPKKKKGARAGSNIGTSSDSDSSFSGFSADSDDLSTKEDAAIERNNDEKFTAGAQSSQPSRSHLSGKLRSVTQEKNKYEMRLRSLKRKKELAGAAQLKVKVLHGEENRFQIRGRVRSRSAINTTRSAPQVESLRSNSMDSREHVDFSRELFPLVKVCENCGAVSHCANDCLFTQASSLDSPAFRENSQPMHREFKICRPLWVQSALWTSDFMRKRAKERNARQALLIEYVDSARAVGEDTAKAKEQALGIENPRALRSQQFKTFDKEKYLPLDEERERMGEGNPRGHEQEEGETESSDCESLAPIDPRSLAKSFLGSYGGMFGEELY